MINQSQNEYMLLFRGKDWDTDLSTDELARMMDRVTAWFERLQQQGKIKGGQPLGREGRSISGAPGNRMVTDGPFAESKEAVGGYLLLRADSMEEAAAIAESCPTLEVGIAIEVRPVLEECPVFQRIQERLVPALA